MEIIYTPINTLIKTFLYRRINTSHVSTTACPLKHRTAVNDFSRQDNIESSPHLRPQNRRQSFTVPPDRQTPSRAAAVGLSPAIWPSNHRPRITEPLIDLTVSLHQQKLQWYDVHTTRWHCQLPSPVCSYSVTWRQKTVIYWHWMWLRTISVFTSLQRFVWVLMSVEFKAQHEIANQLTTVITLFNKANYWLISWSNCRWQTGL